MIVDGKHYRTIEASLDQSSVIIIDQTRLPFDFHLIRIASLHEMEIAITTMQVRGAPLIGVSAAFGIALACNDNVSDNAIERAKLSLLATRPTAINLAWAVTRLCHALLATPEHQRKDKAWDLAQSMADEDVSINRRIGLAGLTLLEPIDKPIINVLTHCNAGWLATIDFGTALSPIYEAKAKGLAVHVWVDETRPRNQGMSLTAWELEKAGIPHTVISDNAGGLLMQQGKVDCVLVGADRVGIDGSVCNKIGTYLKALPAKVHKVPFYVAAPKSTLDKDFTFANQTFEIENRDERELFRISGINKEGHLTEVRIGEAKGYNPAFDITPPEYISKLICEDGVFDPSQLRSLLL